MYINAGDFFIIPAKTAHVYAANEENPWTIYWIHFKGILSGSIISLIEKRMKGLKGFLQFDSTNISLFNDIYREVQRGYGIDHLIYANMCLSHLLTSFIYNDKFEPNGKLAKKDVTDLAIDFLKRHLDEALTLEEIARSVNLSATHFCSLFKKKTGFSPIEYFSHLKVQKACQYLLFTKLRVKEISLELGIDDPYYFSRIFSKVMGISPKDYREKRGH